MTVHHIACREQLSKLAVHVELASKLSAAIEAGHLTDIGALEQAMAYGDAGSKEMIALLTGPLAAKLQPADKVCTLNAYSTCQPLVSRQQCTPLLQGSKPIELLCVAPCSCGCWRYLQRPIQTTWMPPSRRTSCRHADFETETSAC